MRNRLVIVFLSLLTMIIFITACSAGTSSTAPTSASVTTTLVGSMPASTTALDGATLIQERCTRCHPSTFIEKSRHTAADWKLIVDTMINRGAQLTSDEETLVVNYLAANYGQ